MTNGKEPIKITRRNLLRLMGFSAAGAALAACAPAATAVPATATTAPTAVPTAVPATAVPAATVTAAKWAVTGDYFESCSCDYICPCVTKVDGKPTQGYCAFGMLMHIDKGQYGSTVVDGFNVAVVGRSPEAMGQGNWSLGLIIDALANAEQQKALVAIFGGAEGGPMGAIAPAVGTNLGFEVKPIQYVKNGMSRSVVIGTELDQAIEGMAVGANPDEPLYLDNVGHFVNTRLALAHATRSHVHAFGLDWDNVSGTNNGHYAPFSWTV